MITVGPRGRNPWPIRIGVGCGGLMVLSFLLVVAAVVLSFVWASIPHRTADGRCKSDFGTSCTELTPQFITRVTGMHLPPGTVIEQSRYDSFQDWHLEATFLVPAPGVAQWEQSVAGWPPVGGSDCGKFPGRGPARCTEQQHVDATYRQYARADQSDGSVLVWVRVFTT
ncbi:hypothetical protein GCM10028815_30480 [Mariniluteicoccus flavus]